jgi:hypothetical protein
MADGVQPIMARGIGGYSPANVQKFLKGQSYPARKDDLLETARSNHAPHEIIQTIQGLPDDEFAWPAGLDEGL